MIWFYSCVILFVISNILYKIEEIKKAIVEMDIMLKLAIYNKR